MIGNLFALNEHLKRLSSSGDPLEELSLLIDFEVFRPLLDEALNYADGRAGGRPAYDPVMMFKVLVLASLNNVSDEKMEFYIRDRFSWLRFLKLKIGEPTPDRNTIWSFRERLTRANAIEALFKQFDNHLKQSGYVSTDGHIIDSTIVRAPRQRLRSDEKEAIKSGKKAAEIWPEHPNKAAQKDTDARWVIMTGKNHNKDKNNPKPAIVTPQYGYKNHSCIDQEYGFIRNYEFSDACSHDSRHFISLLPTQGNGQAVYADTAYRSKTHEDWLSQHGYNSQVHEKKPPRQAMPNAMRERNRKRSSVRARVEHVFGHQKQRMKLFIETIGLERAQTKIGLVNLAYNMQRLIFHERKRITG